VVGTDGSIYVTGVVRRTGTYDDGLTVKYSAGGRVLWSRYYNGHANGSDNLLAMALDAKNRVYVTGFDYATGRANDCLLIRYSPSGHWDWVRRWGNTTVKGHEIGFDVAVRGSYVAVAGMTTADPVGLAACGLALKYSTAGALKWKRTYTDDDPTLDATWNHVGIDGRGRVAVGGYAAVSAPSDIAWVTTVYSSAGTAASVLKMQGDPSIGGNYVRDLRMTAVGKVYETGCLGYPASSLDMYTIALRYNGTPLWGSIINDTVGANDYGLGIVTTSKAVYVGGTMYQDLVLLKYKP
jgi:hypothetical protein